MPAVFSLAMMVDLPCGVALHFFISQQSAEELQVMLAFRCAEALGFDLRPSSNVAKGLGIGASGAQPVAARGALADVGELGRLLPSHGSIDPELLDLSGKAGQKFGLFGWSHFLIPT